MATVKIILRILLGLIFTVFGLNILLHFLPNPPQPPAAQDFFVGLFKSGYFLPMLGVFQTLCGILLLLGVAVPLALTMLAPIIINIVMFHLFLAPGGLPIAAIVVALEAILAWMYREAFAPLFSGSVQAS